MKILIASSIDPQTIEELRKNHDVVCAFDAKEDRLLEVIQDREILVFRSGVMINAKVMEAAPKLQLLIRAGSGLDNIDLAYAQSRSIQLERIPEPGARAVAEMTFALMLSLSRNVVHANELWKQGVWAKKRMGGHLINGKTLGVIGLGSIGTTVAKLGKAWGMKAIGCVESYSTERRDALHESGIELMNFNDVLMQADILSLHVPFNATTKYMINEAALKSMKKGSFLINLARGGVVQETALYNALLAGKIKGAALDVHEKEGDGNISPLAELSNVILTPHIGAMALESQKMIGDRVLEILDKINQKNAVSCAATY